MGKFVLLTTFSGVSVYYNFALSGLCTNEVCVNNSYFFLLFRRLNIKPKPEYLKPKSSPAWQYPLVLDAAAREDVAKSNWYVRVLLVVGESLFFLHPPSSLCNSSFHGTAFFIVSLLLLHPPWWRGGGPFLPTLRFARLLSVGGGMMILRRRGRGHGRGAKYVLVLQLKVHVFCLLVHQNRHVRILLLYPR